MPAEDGQDFGALERGHAVRRAGDGLVVVCFLALAGVPLVDFVGRPLAGFHVPGSATYVHLLTFYLTFLGGLIATLTGRHLTLSTSSILPEGRPRMMAAFVSAGAAAAVTAVLAYASVLVVLAEKQQGRALPVIGIKTWVIEIAMPVALGAMAASYAFVSSKRWNGRLVVVALVAAVFALGLLSPSRIWAWTLSIAILAATLLGSPVFAAMSGLALILFWTGGTPVSAVTAEIFRLVASPTLPAIPLLTACGFILAETQAAHRLVRFFRALLGFLPGGVAVLVGAVCALFTAFTGGSGVTIIALGGLVYPILREDGYPESFSLGLVTAAGSLGLLFPPSLPVILYSVVAQVPADSLFIAGLLPGLLLVVLVALYGITVGCRVGTRRQPFSWREAALATWSAKWELSIPVLMVVLFATGLASIVETSAVACVYTIVIACFIQKDLHPLRQLPAALLKAAAMVGAVLILLSCALGFTSYLVDAQIPDWLLGAVQKWISSPVTFLLVLNVILLVLGSVIEIYSAIVILTPLVIPLGEAFGIHPVHLGVIFLANLELGFLFPPVGLNLFLSSSRFGRPMTELYRHVIPFLIILGAGVLLITYVPSMSLGVLRFLGRG